MSIEYWKIAIEESLGEHGIVLSDEQLSAVAVDMDNAHLMYGEATGLNVVTANYHASRQSEIDVLKAELKTERDALPCEVCKGGTAKEIGIGGRLVPMDCWKCGGKGRYPRGHRRGRW
ncbi:MAG: hypothetical protein AAFQ22_13240 [Pseudomonadota bacterium]